MSIPIKLITSTTAVLFTASITSALPAKPQPLVANMHKAKQGGGMSFSYTNLPKHEGVTISFKVHFVGPWDGTGYAKWGPDRFIAKVDNKLHLLDATFNNCHIKWSDNVWQSFPDPHQYRQLDERGRTHFLYHGGEGATAISGLGFQWNGVASIDSSYTFNFTVSHQSKQLDLAFLTNWVEDNSPSTYWIEGLKATPITELKKLNPSQEERAWLSFLQGDGLQAQKAWADVYAAHPEELIKRVRQLIELNPERVDFLIKQLAKGEGKFKIPTRAIQKEVLADPRNKHAAQIMLSIRYMRELALNRKIWSSQARKNWTQLETNNHTRSIRKAMGANYTDSIMLEQISLRLSGYLRMINTREARHLAAQFDPKDPEFELSPIQPFEGKWKDENSEFHITVHTNGTAKSTNNNQGTWKFSKEDLTITWENGNTVSLTNPSDKCSATIITSQPKKMVKKVLMRVAQ